MNHVNIREDRGDFRHTDIKSMLFKNINYNKSYLYILLCKIVYNYFTIIIAFKL